MDFERAACASTNARKHMQRAYYQQQLWVQAPFTDIPLILNADAYGFVRKGSLLVSEIVISKPEGLPDPSSVSLSGSWYQFLQVLQIQGRQILLPNELLLSSPYLDSVVKVLPCNTGNKPVVLYFSL